LCLGLSLKVKFYNLGGNPTLGYDIVNARLDSLRYERRYLANVFFLIARLGYLSASEITKMVDWLALNPNHALIYNILTATLAAFDPVDPESTAGKARKALAMDNSVMSFMNAKLYPSAEWKDLGLKATILLKWTLFLTETRHGDHSLENRDGFKTEELETRIWNSVQGDAFLFLTQAVIHLQRKRGSPSTSSYCRDISLSPEQEQQRELPADDFRPAVLQAFENLVRSLITHASSELRKIKQRQEDLVMSSVRTDRSRFRVASMPSPADQTSPRNDIAILYSLIGLLYSALPAERALQFWGSGPHVDSHRGTYLESMETTAGKLPTFLQWAVWSTQMRDQDMSMALYDMLAGLSKGQHCSELAYNFMARGGGEVIPGSVLPSSSGTAHYGAGPTVSWNAIFGQLEAWAAPGADSRPNQVQAQPAGLGLSSSQPWQNQHPHASQQSPQQITLGRKEVLLAQAFLRLLSNVVTHSVAVRIAISGNAHLRAIPTLVALIPLGIPMELKGALFEALAAFCEPGAGVSGIEICKAVWTLMERLEVINVRGGSGLLPSVKGVEVELEEVEASHKLYPVTIPFLRLLSTLIHTPKRVHLKERVVDVEPINTTPESLGQPYRLPGIGPFISFVIDNVFTKIPNREYLRPSDRWETNDLCLCFIERCLGSYELESLLSSEDDLQLRRESVGPLLVHPGYDVMKRLLTNSPLQASVLSYLVEGVEGFEKEFAEEEPYFRSTIIRVLRIVLRVLEIQDIFIDVLIPLLSEFDSAPIVGTTHARSYFTKFDQALSFGPQFVPAVAAYVAFPAHPELVLLSVKILTLMCTSTAFSNLATLIERSGHSERILNGFRLIMESEALDNVVISETIAEQTTGAGAPDKEGYPESLEQAIRLAALDLFVQNTEHRRPYPNIAHFLLFGGMNTEQPIQDPHALGAYRTCVHVILDMLNAGVPRAKGKGSNQEHQTALQIDPLFVTLPGLAERCYRVIYQLCVHPRTSDFTMRYLRTREDFFARHLAAIPSQVPSTLEEPFIEVLYNNGSRVTTTVSALSSFLRLRSCIMDLVALNLHVLTNKGHHKGVTNLLEILFGNGGNEVAYQDSSSEWEDDLLRPFQEVGQSHLRIIELVQSLMFDWSDSLTVSHVELEFLNQLNLHSCIRVDANGCEIVDRTALLSLLAMAKRVLHAQGRIVTTANAEQLSIETAYILESCAVENHRRGVVYAVANSYESWRRLLDTTLVKCFGRLPHDRRENMLFDLLHVLPTIIRSADVQESTAVLLSEAVLSAITKLREDRSQQIVIQSAGGDADAGSLPVERLKSLLRSLLQCILDNNRLELVRGNLYAALINYLHLVASTRTDAGAMGRGSTRQPLSLSTSTTQDDFIFSDNQSSFGAASQFGGPSAPSSALESGSLAVMKSVMERLVATIARDAIDGAEVWRTIAFMSLDSLVQLSRSEKPHIVLSALVRHGVLSNFVRGLKESDLRLQAVLKPDPGKHLVTYNDITSLLTTNYR
jgi:nuclear pore complex protein Nup205